MQQPFLSIREIILKGALTILRGKSREVVGVKEIEVIKIAAIGQGILREDNVALAFTRFVEKRGDEAARVGAAYIDHSGAKRAEHGFAVIEELLRGPIMG